MDELLDSTERSRTPPSECSLGAAVLGRIGPDAERRAVDALIEMLPDPDESRRLRIVEALGALGPRAAPSIPALLALMERETSNGVEDGRSAVSRRMSAAGAVCGGGDPRFVAAMIRMMRSSDPGKRSAAASILGESDQPSPAPAVASVLIGLLKDETQSVRSSAASTLGRSDGPAWEAAMPALLEALGDEDEWVRSQVAGALARHRAGVDRVVPMVVRMLQSGNSSLRRVAAEILGEFGTEARLALPALREARQDSVEFVRDEVERALGLIAPPEAANPAH